MTGRRAADQASRRRTVREAAERMLGFDELRPGQEDALVHVLAGHDTLAVLPTGSGKSAIYQLAGALTEGATVVVSPLIALQKDQVDSIDDGLGEATQVNSHQATGAREGALDDVGAGRVEFVLLAAEQLANDETLASLEEARPSLFVVDEAHVISSWGHDFRPEYRRLGPVIERLDHPVVLALTATAAPPVRDEIVAQLGMRDAAVVVAGFERPNLSIGVSIHPDPEAARDALVRWVGEAAGTGIVYAATRAETEDLAARLAREDRPAIAYHAGLASRRRAEVHERFLAGEPCVVVATTAFGMGIDAPHVRYVVHAQAPDSLDSYYQEVGRAGRDGDPARAVLFHARQGGQVRRYQAGRGRLDEDAVRAAVVALVADGGPLDLAALEQVPERRRALVGQRLEAAGAVATVPGGRLRWTGQLTVDDAVERALAEHERARAADRTRIDMMDRFLESDACRWRSLLSYLGQPVEGRCGHCDNCDGGREAGETPADVPFPLDSTVSHAEWGSGRVIGYERDTMTVLFDEGGYRQLSVELVTEGDLLRAG